MYKINFFLNGVAQLINISILLILTPHLIKSIGLNSYGKFIFIHSIFIFISIFRSFTTTFLKILAFKDGYNWFLSIYYLLFFTIIILATLRVMQYSIIDYLIILLGMIIYFMFSAFYIYNSLSSIPNFIMPFINLILYLYFISNSNYTINKNIDILSIALIVAIVIFSIYIFIKSKFNFKFSYKNSRLFKYLYKRSIQTVYFSLVTAIQTNIERLLLPLFGSFELLGLYNLITLIPARLISIYSNLSNIFTKDIYSKSRDRLKYAVESYFKYSTILFLVVSSLVISFHREILFYFLKEYKTEYRDIFILAIIISSIQIFGFISFNILSSINKLILFSSNNLKSAIILTISITTLYFFSYLNLYTLTFSILISKYYEFVNAKYVYKFTKINLIDIWLNYLKRYIIILIFGVIIGFYYV